MKTFHQINRRVITLAVTLVLLVAAMLPLQAKAAEYDGFKKIRNEWQRYDRCGTLWIEYYLDNEMYYHYADLDREYNEDYFAAYVNDPYNRELIAGIVDGCFGSVADATGMDRNQILREMVTFVQEKIRYQTDLDSVGLQDYPRYPIETLYEGRGDCEDSSILLACMLREYGYDVALLLLPGHAAVAIRVEDNYENGTYYQTERGRYIFIETTCGGWELGEIPSEFQNCSAQFYWL